MLNLVFARATSPPQASEAQTDKEQRSTPSWTIESNRSIIKLLKEAVDILTAICTRITSPFLIAVSPASLAVRDKIKRQLDVTCGQWNTIVVNQARVDRMIRNVIMHKNKNELNSCGGGVVRDLLTRPAHSIINQSFDSRLRIDHRRPLNGDGFGVGWYDSEKDNIESEAATMTPCIFTSVTPAWSNSNLVRLAEKIKSPLLFAHVRASTSGAVTEANCHPWNYGRIMWMHNGGIAQFNKIKRKLQSSLPEELYLFVEGNTDSEWAFALFLSFLEDPKAERFKYQELKDAMLKTIAQLNEWAEEENITEPSLLNFAVTDGESVVCVRYISSKTEEAASLYFSSGTKFECYRPGHYRMVKADRREDMVVVASEPLTFEKADWLTIPTNTVMVITPKLNVLMQPIKDKFYADERGLEVKVGQGGEDVARIPEPRAQMIAHLAHLSCL
ncbi:hypothetical protein VTP01DRAFT_1821 [Rhizomucor pusillus]|uniref:uncharacterized protein n=1 Tax=Rhizomucor pusillus TaxID=4840 RepID=UPI0037441281